MDVAVAGSALALTLPCWRSARWRSGWRAPGVLFRQERVSLHGRRFEMLKLRSLRPSSERESQVRWTVAGDRRVGPVGRVLRATSLDELPQLVNVLRGEMSLVGPRPERPYFVEQFGRQYPRYDDRHRVPAGLTGWAAVNGLRGDTSIGDRIRYDNNTSRTGRSGSTSRSWCGRWAPSSPEPVVDAAAGSPAGAGELAAGGARGGSADRGARGSRPPGPRTLRTARAIVLLALAELVGKLGTLVVVVGAARLLPLADFGVFSVALAAGVIVAVLPSWGFDTTPHPARRGDPAELPTLLAELLALRLALAVGRADHGRHRARGHRYRASTVAAVGCVVAACLADTVTDAYRAVAVACEQQSLVARAQVLQRAATAVLTLLALVIWQGLRSCRWPISSAPCSARPPPPAGTAQLGIRPSWRGIGWPGLRRLGRASWSAGAHAVASMALFRADAVLLAAIAGAAAAGRYAAAYAAGDRHLRLLDGRPGGLPGDGLGHRAGAGAARSGAWPGGAVHRVPAVRGAAVVPRRRRAAAAVRRAVRPRRRTALAWLAPGPILFGAAWLPRTCCSPAARRPAVSTASRAGASRPCRARARARPGDRCRSARRCRSHAGRRAAGEQHVRGQPGGAEQDRPGASQASAVPPSRANGSPYSSRSTSPPRHHSSAAYGRNTVDSTTRPRSAPRRTCAGPVAETITGKTTRATVQQTKMTVSSSR